MTLEQHSMSDDVAEMNFNQHYVAATSDPLPEGTIPYARAGEEEKHESLPDQFGVRELNLYSGDTPEYQETVLVHYGSNSNASDDIRVRVRNINLDGTVINCIGELVCDFYETYEMLVGAKNINKPVDKFERAILILPKIRRVQGIVATVKEDMKSAIEEIGIVKDKLMQSVPTMLGKIIEILNELQPLSVMYFSNDLHQVNLNERTFQYYHSQLELEKTEA